MASGYARISMAKCFSCFYNSTIFLLQIQVIICCSTHVSVYRENNWRGFCFLAEEWWPFSDCVETFLFLIHRQIGILNN